jgi:hypothetical protein
MDIPGKWSGKYPKNIPADYRSVYGDRIILPFFLLGMYLGMNEHISS